MPELPEVETSRLILKKEIIGKKIKTIKVLEKKQFQGSTAQVIGQKITGLERRGKLLALRLSNGSYLLIHLKLTGQLVFAPRLENNQAVFPQPIPFAGGQTLPGRSTRIIIFFSDGSALFFNDLRKFGWIRVASSREKEKEFAALGKEPFSPGFTVDYLGQLLASSRRPVKLLLMDQKKIAGLGNIYANEALFLAQISPLRAANSLTPTEVRHLFRAIRQVIKKGIAAGGTSAADDAYVKPNGQPGRFQNQLQVYQRAGQPCPRCQTTIKRIKLGNRGTFYCPQCQK